MYCKKHNFVGCSTCMLKKHSSCKDKLYIPDFIKTNTTAINSNEVEKELESIAKSLTKLQEALMEEKEDLKGNKDNVLKEIGTFRDKINQLLDQFEKNIVQQLEQRFMSLTNKIDSSLRDLQATATEIKAAQDHLKSAGGNMPQKFVSVMQANQVVSSAEEKVKKNESHFCPQEMYFLTNKKLQILFSEIQGLGSIRVREKLKTTGRQKYPVNVKSDLKECHIISVCTLNDSTIILADFKNSNLKRLDSSSNSVTDCCDVPQEPYQVCAVSDTEVAVSCRIGQLIQFVNVGWTMKKTRRIKTGFRCKGLAYADERLFVSDETSVYMFSLLGEQLQRLYNDQSVRGLVSNGIQALAINSDKSKIYVADCEKGLIILDMNGQLVRQYNGDKLSGACDVCIDNNDNVLICHDKSRNVLQFSPNGKLIGEVLKTDGYGKLNTVCCNNNNSTLIAGLRFNNEIGVYDMNAE